MSATGYWEIVRPPKGKYLPEQLRRAIAKKFMGHDGTLTGSVELDANARGWLEGFRDATDDAKSRNTAEAILEAIDVHTTVRVWIER